LPMNEILTVREGAALLKINEKTAYKLAAKGDIPRLQGGRLVAVRQGEIESWIKRQTEKQGQQG
jgi:excisionase family DNA binding protein